ncbi:MAG: Asp23/Gls24 family envelope stress response protein [Parachlamydiales bacterium]
MEKRDSFLGLNKRDLNLPETTYVRDIETRVFQGIVAQCLSKIEGIGLIGGGLIDNLLGIESERLKGIFVEQDEKKHSVLIRVELNILYGVSIPEKAEEIQNKVAEEVSAFSGLHVAMVHVVFKSLITNKALLTAPEEEKTEYSQRF